MTPDNKKRLFLFLTLAFGIAWLVALVIALGGLAESPVLISLNLTLAAALGRRRDQWRPPWQTCSRAC